MAVEEIVQVVEQTSIEHVVVTGGEPMLFDAVGGLLAELKARDRTITIETAGTVFREVDCDLMSISPKLANSTPPGESGWSARHEGVRLDRSALPQLMARYDCQLKFVVNPDSSGEVEEIEELLAPLPRISPEKILLMPEGTDSETLHRRMRALVPVCMQKNWRLTPRLHVDLFGNTRGT
jgi:7-carboxy-7-deazaguanine synthase